MRPLLTGVFLLTLSAELLAQRPARDRVPRPAGCRFQLDSVGGLGTQNIVGADTNYFAGGYVRLKCGDGSVTISSDSVALYGRGANTTVQFIRQVEYRDSVTIQTADRGTYYRSGERWEARGNVVTKNLKNGSTINGPSLDYYRAVPGVRDTVEIFAIGRPTIRSVTTDSAGNPGEPYVIVADRVRMKGNDRTWAGGKVTIDRSDFAARGDSLFLDSGAGNSGVLVGEPVLRGTGRDSFELRGRRIELTLENREITYVTALNDGHAISSQVDLVADTIGLDLEQRVLIQTLAWGDSTPPRAVTEANEIRGDSLAFDTPERLLREVRAFGRGWVGGKVDSATGERDWMSGDSVVAIFTTWDSAGTPRTALAQLAAAGSARSFYRVNDARRPTAPPSINYSRGQKIIVHMKPAGQRGVERVDFQGAVDGVHLEPLPPVVPADSAAAAKPASSRGRQ